MSIVTSKNNGKSFKTFKESFECEQHDKLNSIELINNWNNYIKMRQTILKFLRCKDIKVNPVHSLAIFLARAITGGSYFHIIWPANTTTICNDKEIQVVRMQEQNDKSWIAVFVKNLVPIYVLEIPEKSVSKLSSSLKENKDKDNVISIINNFETLLKNKEKIEKVINVKIHDSSNPILKEFNKDSKTMILQEEFMLE